MNATTIYRRSTARGSVCNSWAKCDGSSGTASLLLLRILAILYLAISSDHDHYTREKWLAFRAQSGERREQIYPERLIWIWIEWFDALLHFLHACQRLLTRVCVCECLIVATSKSEWMGYYRWEAVGKVFWFMVHRTRFYYIRLHLWAVNIEQVYPLSWSLHSPAVVDDVCEFHSNLRPFNSPHTLNSGAFCGESHHFPLNRTIYSSVWNIFRLSVCMPVVSSTMGIINSFRSNVSWKLDTMNIDCKSKCGNKNKTQMPTKKLTRSQWFICEQNERTGEEETMERKRITQSANNAASYGLMGFWPVCVQCIVYAI